MAITATEIDPAFIVNTGDNFYWCGIQNSTDPQINVDFELPYAAPSLENLEWFRYVEDLETAVTEYSESNLHSFFLTLPFPFLYYQHSRQSRVWL